MREQSTTNTLPPNSPHAFSWVRTPFNGRRSLRMTRRLHCNHHCPCGLSASLSCCRCVRDNDISAVTALDKIKSPDIREPFNPAKHLVSSQKSFVQLRKREKLHKCFLQ